MTTVYKTFTPPVTPLGPILGRKYTLTHSDQTGDLFLTVGPTYNLNAPVADLKDGVYGEWIDHTEDLLGLFVWVGDMPYETARRRYNTFVENLPLAIGGILYGDREFFNAYPELLKAPVLIKFDSIHPEFNQVVNYGPLKNYIR